VSLLDTNSVDELDVGLLELLAQLRDSVVSEIAFTCPHAPLRTGGSHPNSWWPTAATTSARPRDAGARAREGTSAS
jgi:hypothetical protein